MTAHPHPVPSVWTAIEQERARDRRIRRASAIAWALTIAIVLVYAGIVAARVSHVLDLVAVGMLQRSAVFDALMPLIAVLGTLSLLIAVLCTVAVFLRFRAASLAEIQLRLAALEEAVRAGRLDVTPT